MRRAFLAIAIGLLALIAYTRCEQAPEPAKPGIHQSTLTDDNGKKFVRWVDDNKSYIPENIKPNAKTGDPSCVFPDCGYQNGKKYCCSGTGSCWPC